MYIQKYIYVCHVYTYNIFIHFYNDRLRLRLCTRMSRKFIALIRFRTSHISSTLIFFPVAFTLSDLIAYTYM